ncbi:hypothetical protein CK203_100734 [Vitis vinifera]|uniref:Reverse transcriptase zinc-binding domain-containing protein n=1 Tax=Vitis vinifera TaxID=29760 RepID=A0A438DET9_VITVI|nr:hypothetical protein CK203_100734 [Vitis vinifera]
MGHLVTPSFGFVVGDAKKVRFWKDKWCGTIPLCETFPSLYALASYKEAWGKKVRVDEEDKVRWMDSKDWVFSPKLSFFKWEASWGRVLTLDHLQKRDIKRPITDLCPGSVTQLGVQGEPPGEAMQISLQAMASVRNLRIGAMMRTVLPALAQAVVLHSSPNFYHKGTTENIKEKLQV